MMRLLIQVVAFWGLQLVLAESAPGAGNVNRAIRNQRASANDALHAVYLFSHLCGEDVPFSDVAEMLPADTRVSIRDLQQMLAEFGLFCEVYRHSCDKLAKSALPAIVYMESEGPTGGGFWILLRIENEFENVYVCDAGRVTFKKLRLDEFKRSWSGYALLQKSSRENSIVVMKWVLTSLIVFLLARIIALSRKVLAGERNTSSESRSRRLELS